MVRWLTMQLYIVERSNEHVDECGIELRGVEFENQ